MMEWGIALNLREPVSEIIEKSMIADKGKIETIWITDFPATRLSPVLASAVAERTEKSRIGIGLLSPLIYSSSHIIQMMTTLIETYGERFDLLIGPGDRTRLKEIGVSYGDVSTIVTRIRDSVTSIRESLLEYNDCKVFVGAQGSKMIEASTCSDGVLLNYSDSEMIEWAITTLGKRPQGFKIGIFSPSLIGSSKKCDEYFGIKASAAIVALGLNPSILRRFGLKDKLQPAIDKMKENGLTQDLVEMIDQEILDRFSLCGDIEANIDQLENYKQMGVDMVVYGPPQGASLIGVKQLVNAIGRR